MVRDTISFLVALCGVAVMVGMYLRLQAFPRNGREAVIASAIGLFVISKCVSSAVHAEDYVFAFGAAGYMLYFATSQFRSYPRLSI